MKKSMAIAAGAAAAFAAAFLPLKNFCKDRLDKSIVSQIPEIPEKYIKVFGFKDKAGNVFIEIVQISDSCKYRSADIDGGGILELKDAEKKGFIPQGTISSTLDNGLFILNKTYLAKGAGADGFSLRQSDFAFTPRKDGKKTKYPLELSGRDFPITIQPGI